MRHLIMGTAGHIDHGKTSLIKALSGIDCDTHPEEKQRGITIHLGFSHLQLDENTDISIIDVPGHKNFINTMISGANGFDFVLLLISADSGIMPQTLEHFQIMKLLNIKKGIIVINKIDLVDKENIAFLHEEIKDLTKNSFLEKAEIVEVSAKTGEGLPILLEAIKNITQEIEDKDTDSIFRLYIDRVFQIKGFGLIVTGSVLSGRLHKNDTCYLLPSKTELKIRRLERHSLETDMIQAGDRASINLQGIDFDSIKKGMLISNLDYDSTKLIDAKLDLYEKNLKLDLWSQVVLISGTQEIQAKLHLIDKDSLKSKESALVQIHLEKELPLCIYDKFIIRNSSADISLGGGYIIDPHPLHHRRRTQKVIELLKKIAEGDLKTLIQEEIKKLLPPLSIKEIQFKLALTDNQISFIKEVSFDENIISFYYKDELYFWQKAQANRFTTRCLRNLQSWHKNNIYDTLGKTADELSGILSEYPLNKRLCAINYVILSLQEQKLIEKRANTFAMKSHKVVFSVETNKALQWTENYIKYSGMKTPLWSEMLHKAKFQNIDEKTLKQLCTYLYRRKKVYYIEEAYLYYKLVDDCRIKLLEYLIKHTEGISVSQYRDLIDGNRKICLILLAQYDIEAIVNRLGDLRFITEKGRQFLFDNQNM